MRKIDRLPPVLRAWLANAAMPWGPRLAKRAYNLALVRFGDPQKALSELDRYSLISLQRNL